MLQNYAMDLCHYHWRWLQPKNWVMIWFCFANHLIWGSRWHFSWTRRKSIHQVEIFRLIELDTSIQLSLSNPCFPPCTIHDQKYLFFLRIWSKIPHIDKNICAPGGKTYNFLWCSRGLKSLTDGLVSICSSWDVFFPRIFIMKCV